MSRVNIKIERWHRLERILGRSPKGVNISDLVAELGVHRSTIYRDIEQLSQSGVPIWEERGKVGILIDEYFQPLCLSIYESLSVFIALRLLIRATNEYNPHVKSTLEKIADIVPVPISEHIDDCVSFLNKAPNNPLYIHNLELLMWAWLHKHRIKMWYQSTWTQVVKERLFDVYFIEPIETWNTNYVIGWDHLHNEMRVFKIKRIHKIEVLDETYSIQAKFNSFAHWGNTWGFVFIEKDTDIQVRLKFSPRAAFLVRETIWHQSQQIEDLDDGGCIFTVKLDADLFKVVYGIKSWILSWGRDVEVLEPESLRISIFQEIEAARSNYQPH